MDLFALMDIIIMTSLYCFCKLIFTGLLNQSYIMFATFIYVLI